MIVRHCCCSVVILATLGAACCLAQDQLEAVLGPAELIGSLLTPATEAGPGPNDAKETSVNRESTAGFLITLQAAPQLGEPILLASLLAGEEITTFQLPDPMEICRQLQLTARLLESAGLEKHASSIDAIRNDFEINHLDRLALAMKRAELAKLQDEINRLSARVEGAESPSNENSRQVIPSGNSSGNSVQATFRIDSGKANVAPFRRGTTNEGSDEDVTAPSIRKR